MGSFSFLRARRFSTSLVKKTDSKELVPSKPPPVGAHKDEAPEPNVKVVKPPNFSCVLTSTFRDSIFQKINVPLITWSQARPEMCHRHN
jgi:hypothetical protein